MSISKIKQAITELSSEKLNRSCAWFDEYHAQVWDKRIEVDAKLGRLDKPIAEANEEHKVGLSKPL